MTSPKDQDAFVVWQPSLPPYTKHPTFLSWPLLFWGPGTFNTPPSARFPQIIPEKVPSAKVTTIVTRDHHSWPSSYSFQPWLLWKCNAACFERKIQGNKEKEKSRRTNYPIWWPGSSAEQWSSILPSAAGLKKSVEEKTLEPQNQKRFIVWRWILWGIPRRYRQWIIFCKLVEKRPKGN